MLEIKAKKEPWTDPSFLPNADSVCNENELNTKFTEFRKEVVWMRA
jgi:hypothetical protein